MQAVNKFVTDSYSYMSVLLYIFTELDIHSLQQWPLGSITCIPTYVHYRNRSINIISGIPQGSVLKLLLFLLYINDIPDLVQSNLKMFVDDIKIIIYSHLQYM